MRGVRFYAVMPEGRTSKSASKRFPRDPFTVARLKELAREPFAPGLLGVNCVAVFAESARVPGRGAPVRYDGAARVLPGVANSVEGCTLDADWLRKRCVRVPEYLALAIDQWVWIYCERAVYRAAALED